MCSIRPTPIAPTSPSATTAIFRRAAARCSCRWTSLQIDQSSNEDKRLAWALYIVSGLLSLGLIVHCIKTGRNTIWVYVLVVLISFPFVGSLVYLGAEVLPDLLRSRGRQRAMRGFRKTLDPEGELRRAAV